MRQEVVEVVQEEVKEGAAITVAMQGVVAVAVAAAVAVAVPHLYEHCSVKVM